MNSFKPDNRNERNVVKEEKKIREINGWIRKEIKDRQKEAKYDSDVDKRNTVFEYVREKPELKLHYFI